MARVSIDTWAPPAFRPIMMLVGGMLLALSAAMLIPAAFDLFARNEDWRAFALSSAVTAAFGAGLVSISRTKLAGGLTLRQAFVLTPLTWLTVALFAALPLYFSDYAQLRDSFTNAFFEAVSGLTTTGATVIVGLQDAPPGVLIWRALLQWMGGIGIIATAIAILPALGVGGMQLFRTESSDRSEKVLPRVREIATAIVSLYLGFTALCAVAYWLAGMTPFDALAHALTTISTAGFSTHDNSLGNWTTPAVHWIAIVGMLAGAVPFVLYVRLFQGQLDTLRNSQVRVLFGFLAVVIALMSLWLVSSERYELGDAIRHAAMNVVSVVTTTGFASTDYGAWGNVAVGVFFGLMFVGGCTGSTAGGVKIFRYEVMARLLHSHFLHLLYPRGVFPRSYAGRALPDDVVASVVVFFSLFFVCYSVITIVLMAFDLDFLTSASAAVSALSNVGPGLGPIIGPAGTFGPLPDPVKWVLAFAMLLGRLELFTVLILFMPRFWRG
ncbi:TrkH family potassium uptake protein [Salinarimonas ramus]|uniref:Trk system potassium uptake protein n=1 Tax=Salinarimonas ramus TaxID=690164 RepID=A0A917QDR7_9HYPH|nr:TrkH family potassium uptake protein [Salinarimonas ramus]GGK45484.1 Trk system potassium uptake protein [Salinarimonas ramus]